MKYRNKQTGEIVEATWLDKGAWASNCWDIRNAETDEFIDYLKDKDFQEQYEPVEQMVICQKRECKFYGECGGSTKPHRYDPKECNCKIGNVSCIPVEKEPQMIGGWHLCCECGKPVTNGEECVCND